MQMIRANKIAALDMPSHHMVKSECNPEFGVWGQ